jgi:hypothetical protein
MQIIRFFIAIMLTSYNINITNTALQFNVKKKSFNLEEVDYSNQSDDEIFVELYYEPLPDYSNLIDFVEQPIDSSYLHNESFVIQSSSDIYSLINNISESLNVNPLIHLNKSNVETNVINITQLDNNKPNESNAQVNLRFEKLDDYSDLIEFSLYFSFFILLGLIFDCCYYWAYIIFD